MAIWAGIASIIGTALVMSAWVGVPAADVTMSGCVQPEAAFLQASGIGTSATDASLAGQVVLVDGSGIGFSVNGTRERDLGSRVGKRVEVTGTIESPVGDPASSAPTLQRINVRSFRATTGACPPLRAATRRAAPDAAPRAAAPAKPASADSVTSVPQRTTVRGCLIVDAETPPRFLVNDIQIEGMVSALTPHKGAMVEVSGMFVEDSAAGTAGDRVELPVVRDGARLPAPAPLAAHPSASRRIVVDSVRAVGGACP